MITWLLKDELAEEVLGDLEEKYSQTCASKSWSLARRNYWYQVIHYLRPFAISIFRSNNSIQLIMLKNYIKIALRNAKKNAAYSGLNIFGLTLGFTACMLIFLWVHHESSVDRFHDNGENIHRIWRNMHQSNGTVLTTGYLPQPITDVLTSEYPEVEHLAAISRNMDLLFERGEVIGNEYGMYASKDFFEVFSYELLVGSGGVLADPTKIVISDKLARKYFDVVEDDFSGVIGETLVVDEEESFMVSGIFRSTSDLSSMEFDWLLPLQGLIAETAWMRSWDSGSIRTFVELAPGTKEAVSQRIEQEVNDHVEEDINEPLFLQPLNDLYLHSQFENGLVSGGRITYVRILSAAAIFLFIVVCLNAMNLITAQSTKRTLEVGIRKVLGEAKGSVRLQFLVESLLFSLSATLLSLTSTWLLLPYFSALIDTPMSIGDLGIEVWVFTLGLVLIAGTLMGLYPAVLLPAMKIISALKGTATRSLSAGSYRKLLIVFQFSISIIIVFAAMIITDQVQFVLNKDIGINKENLILVEMEGALAGKYDTYRNELLQIPEVSSVTSSSGSPIAYGRSTGSAVWAGKDPADNSDVGIMLINDHFVETVGIELLAGRTLSSSYGADTSNYLINEEAVKAMGFEDPINQRLSIWGVEGNIVGVVKNFHTRDLYEPITPMIMSYYPSRTEVALIKLEDTNSDVIAKIEGLTTELNPKYPFEFEFLDQAYAEGYRNEVVVGQIIKLFAIISVIVSCIGLFTLTTYSTFLRTKEIGIRKVYGAGVDQIILMLSKEYSILILISIVLALPVTIIYAQQWLEQFQYRIDLSAFNLALGAIVGMAIGLITVCVKSYQAATANPMKSLRNE
jgi:putative ABC transport system permease protein